MSWDDKVNLYYKGKPVIVYTTFRPPYVDREVKGVWITSRRELSDFGYKVGDECPEGRITEILRTPTRNQVEDALVLDEMNAEIRRNI